MAVHQGGKACLLSDYAAEQLERYEIEPRCTDHKHCRRAEAESMYSAGVLRRISLPGPERFAWIRAQATKVVHTRTSHLPGAPRMPVCQLVLGGGS